VGGIRSRDESLVFGFLAFFQLLSHSIYMPYRDRKDFKEGIIRSILEKQNQLESISLWAILVLSQTSALKRWRFSLEFLQMKFSFILLVSLILFVPLIIVIILKRGEGYKMDREERADDLGVVPFHVVEDFFKGMPHMKFREILAMDMDQVWAKIRESSMRFSTRRSRESHKLGSVLFDDVTTLLVQEEGNQSSREKGLCSKPPDDENDCSDGLEPFRKESEKFEEKAILDQLFGVVEFASEHDFEDYVASDVARAGNESSLFSVSRILQDFRQDYSASGISHSASSEQQAPLLSPSDGATSFTDLESRYRLNASALDQEMEDDIEESSKEEPNLLPTQPMQQDSDLQDPGLEEEVRRWLQLG